MKFYWILTVISFFFWVDNAHSQNKPDLRIISPVDGTFVKPGQELEVIVQGENLPLGGKESIHGDDPLMFSETKETASDLTFHLTIPINIEAGSYGIGAIEISPSGILQSPGIVLKVTPTFKLDNVGFDTNNIFLFKIGQRFRETVIGEFNRVKRPIESELVSFKSLNPAIVTIDPYGVVTTVSDGETQISVTYQSATDPQPVTGFAKVSVASRSSHK